MTRSKTEIIQLIQNRKNVIFEGSSKIKFTKNEEVGLYFIESSAPMTSQNKVAFDIFPEKLNQIIKHKESYLIILHDLYGEFFIPFKDFSYNNKGQLLNIFKTVTPNINSKKWSCYLYPRDPKIIIGSTRNDYHIKREYFPKFFLSEDKIISETKKIISSIEIEKRSPSVQVTNEVFSFQDHSKSVERELAILLGQVSHHIHPEIVNKISKANIEFEKEFESSCHPKLDMQDYFYSGSDCLFPGIRRPVNSEKEGKEKWKNNINEEDGTIFNDNTYPRHIWSLLATNKAYSSISWNESGLNAFELAHIFGHKVDERNLEKGVFKSVDENKNPYALFTSASNVVLIPKGLTKPTDKMDSIKIAFYKRHMDLYGNNLIGLENFDESKVPSWYNEIKWLEPELPNDWEQKIEKLLEYRKKHLMEKYSK